MTTIDFLVKFGTLKNNDIITVYDKSGSSIFYRVYNVYETTIDDKSCTSQETNNKREITLITCNNVNDNRIIVKAKEI